MAEEFCVIDTEHDIPTEVKMECSSIEAAERFADNFNKRSYTEIGTWEAQRMDKVVFVARKYNPRKGDMTDAVSTILKFLGIEPRME